MTKAVYPGSFDPLTLGHANMIERLSRCFDEVIVLVAHSESKKYVFSTDERVDMVNKSTEKYKNVNVDKFNGLTVEYAKNVGANVIARGIRAVSDFEHEMTMSNMNKHLADEIETMVIFSDLRFSFISSQLLKEVAKYGGDMSSFVNEHVEERMRLKFQK